MKRSRALFAFTIVVRRDGHYGRRRDRQRAGRAPSVSGARNVYVPRLGPVPADRPGPERPGRRRSGFPPFRPAPRVRSSASARSVPGAGGRDRRRLLGSGSTGSGAAGSPAGGSAPGPAVPSSGGRPRRRPSPASSQVRPLTARQRRARAVRERRALRRGVRRLPRLPRRRLVLRAPGPGAALRPLGAGAVALAGGPPPRAPARAGCSRGERSGLRGLRDAARSTGCGGGSAMSFGDVAQLGPDDLGHRRRGHRRRALAAVGDHHGRQPRSPSWPRSTARPPARCSAPAPSRPTTSCSRATAPPVAALTSGSSGDGPPAALLLSCCCCSSADPGRAVGAASPLHRPRSPPPLPPRLRLPHRREPAPPESAEPLCGPGAVAGPARAAGSRARPIRSPSEPAAAPDADAEPAQPRARAAAQSTEPEQDRWAPIGRWAPPQPAEPGPTDAAPLKPAAAAPTPAPGRSGQPPPPGRGRRLRPRLGGPRAACCRGGTAAAVVAAADAAPLASRRMSVLVTGACGFVGSRLVAQLVEAGEEVVAVDDLSLGQQREPSRRRRARRARRPRHRCPRPRGGRASARRRSSTSPRSTSSRPATPTRPRRCRSTSSAPSRC